VKNGGSFDWPVEPGEHQVRLKIDWCSSPEVAVIVAHGETSVLLGSAKPMKNGFVMVFEGTFKSKEYILLKVAPSSRATE